MDASSIAVYDATGSLDAPPATVRGMTKRANEDTAALYHGESGVSSIDLRPHTVYGAARDERTTAAMLAAAARKPFTIAYGGAAQMQLARDVARAFVAASLAHYEAASVHDLGAPRRLGRRDRRRDRVDVGHARRHGAAVPRACRQHVVQGVPRGLRRDARFGDGVRETIDAVRALRAAGKVAA